MRLPPAEDSRSIPVLLLVVGGVYKFVLGQAGRCAKHKIEGEVYVLPKDFLINLEGGHFAKLSVALVLEHGYLERGGRGGGHGGPRRPRRPTATASLPQEAAVRAIVTDVAHRRAPRRACSPRRVAGKLQKDDPRADRAETDVKADDVLFTDVAVQ